MHMSEKHVNSAHVTSSVTSSMQTRLPSMQRPMLTAAMGMPLQKFCVPSIGSTIHVGRLSIVGILPAAATGIVLRRSAKRDERGRRYGPDHTLRIRPFK